MLSPSVRMVCIPSASCVASPGSRPCTLFQYCDDTTGMLLIVKYLFNLSNVALTAAPADGYGCCRLEAEQLPCRVEEPVQNRAQGTVRGVVGRRTDDETVRSGQFSVQRIVQFVPKDAAAELAAFVAGDAALHGFRADRDDLGRNSLLFERRSYLGECKKRIPLFTGTSVNE